MEGKTQLGWIKNGKRHRLRTYICTCLEMVINLTDTNTHFNTLMENFPNRLHKNISTSPNLKTKVDEYTSQYGNRQTWTLQQQGKCTEGALQHLRTEA